MISKTEMFRSMIANDGLSVYEHSKNKEVLLVFLRHFGCTFCKEALKELSDHYHSNTFNNTELILVHMSTDDIASKYFGRFNLENVLWVSDSDCKFYTHFGLMKGTFNQLFGFRNWIRGIDAGIIKGLGFERQIGDGFQMPGVFFISQGSILTEFKHKYASDKPDYINMVNCLAWQ
jgi:hypothetical protein